MEFSFGIKTIAPVA